MKANYHTHTFRCKHAYGAEREYIETAIEKGLTTLGFSDHVPVPYPDGIVSGIRMGVSQIPDYTETLLKLREEYRSDIRILIGYEAEYMPAFFDKMIKKIQEYPLDYLIQGQHYVPDEVQGSYAGRPTREESDLRDYVDLTIEGMKTGVFSYLAHPDLINYQGDLKTYRKHMQRLIRTSINLSIPLELNILGFVTGRNYPCDAFFSLASDMGATFIVGLDAHSPEYILLPNEIPGFMDFLDRYNIQPTEEIAFPLKVQK